MALWLAGIITHKEAYPTPYVRDDPQCFPSPAGARHVLQSATMKRADSISITEAHTHAID